MASGRRRRRHRDGQAGLRRDRVDALGRLLQEARDVDGEALERDRPRQVAQVLEQPADGRELAIDHPPEVLAVLRILVELQHQPAVVADVLDRVRQIVDEAGGDAPERRLPLLPHRLGLQRHEPVGHAVEGAPQLGELVAAGDGHSILEPPFGERSGAAHQRVQRPHEAAAPDHRDEEGQRQPGEHGHHQEALQPRRQREGLDRALLDDDPPAERADRPRDAEHLDALVRRVALDAGQRRPGLRVDQRMPEQVLAARHAGAHGGIAVRQQPAGLVDQDGVAAAADPHLVDGAPQLLEAQATDQVGDRRPGVIQEQRDLGRGELGRVDLDRRDVRLPLRHGPLGRRAPASARAGGSRPARRRCRRTASARCRPGRPGRCCAGSAPADPASARRTAGRRRPR